MMDVGRLQKFEGKITAQGKLLLHGAIFCVECINSERNTSSMQKPKELQVFLFEQNIIFSDIIGKKTQFTNPSYIYKSHIQVGSDSLYDDTLNHLMNRFIFRSTKCPCKTLKTPAERSSSSAPPTRNAPVSVLSAWRQPSSCTTLGCAPSISSSRSNSIS